MKPENHSTLTMTFWTLLFPLAALFYCSFTFAEKSHEKRWLYLDGMQRQMVMQLDLVDVIKKGLIVEYSTRIKTRQYYYMKDVGYFNTIAKRYSLNCKGGLTLLWYELHKDDAVIYRKAVNRPVPPDLPNEPVDYLCEGIPMRRFHMELIMSEEDTSRELMGK